MSPIIASCARAAVTAAVVLFPPIAAVAAGDSVRGAQLYVRLADDTRSCVSCHGPDPGQNHNNILRAADNADTLTRVINTVSQMGFLSTRLTQADREDVTAFLGAVTRHNAAASPLTVFPVTHEFGTFVPGAVSPVHRVRVVNRAAAPVPVSVDTPVADGLDVRHDCPVSLPQGGMCELQLRLMPTAAGLTRPVVRIGTPSLPGGVPVALVGRAAGGAMTQLVWDGSPTVLRFQPASPSLRLRLVNPGPLDATLGAQSIVGPAAASFRIDGGCASGTVLSAGAGCELTLSYTPSALPLSLATLQVRSDRGNPASVALEAAAESRVQDAGPAGGGGCSTAPPGSRSHDPLLLGAVLAAACALARNRSEGRRIPVRPKGPVA